MKTLNKLIPILFVSLLFISTSCLKNNDPGPYVPKAALRMVNAYPNAEGLVFVEDNNYITSPTLPIKYNEYTTNLSLLFPGNKRIKVYNEQNKLVSDTTISLKDSTYYTSFVFGNTDKAKNLIATDVSLGNIGTNAALRFLHLANNIGNVSVFFDNEATAIYANIAPEVLNITNTSTGTTFKAHSSGKRKITVKDSNNTILIEREFDFLSNRYYSILLTGDKNSTTKPLYIGIIQQ